MSKLCFYWGIGYRAFLGANLSRNQYFWLSPQNIFGFDYLDDLVSLRHVKFISTSFPSYHKRFYPEYGPLEYDLTPSNSSDLSFVINSNPIEPPIFFMLMIKPWSEKISYTFFTPSFHYQFFQNEELAKNGEYSSGWKARLAVYTHPHEEEEVDCIFPWSYNYERSAMSVEMMWRFRSKHIFRDALISYRRGK